jgi:hypothetical protein
MFGVSIVPLEWWTDIGTEVPVFVALVSALVAGLLFLARIDRKLNSPLSHEIAQSSNSIIDFMARVLVLLRIWDTFPTRIVPLNVQAASSIGAAIEGEDLHDDVWTQKGLYFLIFSIPPTILMVPIPVQSIFIPLFKIGLILVIMVLLRYARSRWFKDFPERALVILKFRYYQDMLLQDQTMREMPREGHDAQPNEEQAYDPSLYKEALVKQFSFVNEIIRRKEWWRLHSHFDSIERDLRELSTVFLDNKALALALETSLELLSPQQPRSQHESEIRYSIFKEVLSSLVQTQKGFPRELVSFCDTEIDRDSVIDSVIALVVPTKVSIRVSKVIGTALSHESVTEVSEETLNRIRVWFSSSSTVECAIDVLSYTDPWSRQWLIRRIRNQDRLTAIL